MKLVIQNTSRVWGGNEKWFSTVAAGLVSKGHDVAVSVPHGQVRDHLRSRGIRTSSFRPRGIGDPLSGLSFGAWLAKEKPDALLATSWNSLAWTGIASRIARIPRFVVRNGIVRSVPSRGARHRVLRGQVDAVIVNAPEIAHRWAESAPWFDPQKIHVVLNAIASRRNDRSHLRSALRAELSVDDATMLIGSAGNLARRKGFDILLEAFSRACVPHAELVVVGDGEQRGELESTARTLGIENRIRFTGRRLDGPDIIGGLDLFVYASRNEGMANVMLEAMAAGVPVIASDISGVQTALGHSDERPPAGWIVDSLSAGDFARTIVELAGAIRAGDEEIARRTEESLWRIEHWFTRDRMLRECEEILFPA